MKKLFLRLAPFAPDHSGAVAMLYEFGGVLLVCDAGGCTGNICGFDEPRWRTKAGAVFSAGLRDMDAIFGRDKQLVERLCSCMKEVDAPFSAIVGTPVPAVIGTDFAALRKLGEKATGRPVVVVPTNGSELYDKGIGQALLALVERFAVDQVPVEEGRLGVLGATPLDLGTVDADWMAGAIRQKGWSKVVCYGMGSGLEELARASSSQMNLVVTPAALPAARLLQKRFGTPFEVGFPLPESARLKEVCALAKSKRVLVIHQQLCANALRDTLEAYGASEVVAATWFMKDPALSRECDLSLKGEEDLEPLLENGGFDYVVGDRVLRKVYPRTASRWIDFPHFAVSGRAVEDAESWINIL